MIERRLVFARRSTRIGPSARDLRSEIDKAFPYRHDEKNPRLGVPESLPHLVLLEVMVLDALSISHHPFHRHHVLFSRQEARFRWDARHEDQEDHGPGEADRAENEEDVHFCSSVRDLRMSRKHTYSIVVGRR